MLFIYYSYGGEIPLTPLSAAAKAGKHEIVAYLLSIPLVTAEGVYIEVCTLASSGHYLVHYTPFISERC